MAKPVPKPSRAMGRDVEMFTEDDVASIINAAQLSKVIDYDPTYLKFSFNNAATRYFVAARFNDASPNYEARNWCNKLAKSTYATLQVLGLEKSQAAYGDAAHGAVETLFYRHQDLARLRPPEAFGLSSDPATVLTSLANALWYVQGQAAAAADFYAAQNKKMNSSKLILSARQSLLHALAGIYQRLTEETIPRRPNSSYDNNPFARFVLGVTQHISERMVPPAPEATIPRDGSDYESAKALIDLDAENIADDVRRKVWPFMNRRGELGQARRS